jgi:hypothetical protein
LKLNEEEVGMDKVEWFSMRGVLGSESGTAAEGLKAMI